MVKRRAQQRAGSDWIVTWPLLVVFAAMVFLALEKTRTPEAGQPPASAAGGAWEERLGERMEILTRALAEAPLALPPGAEEPKGAGALRWIHRRFELDAPQSDAAKLDATLDSLKQLDPGVTVASHPTFDGVEVQVGLDGLLTHTIRVRWRDQQVRPRVALVVGPLGDDLRLARDCVRVDAPLALSVRPFRPFSREVAELGKIFEREVLVELADAPAATALAQALSSVPNAVGVNGEPASPLAGASATLRQAVEERGLLFVATPAAPAPAEGEPALFVLDEQEGSGLAAQIERLVARARSGGAAIGYGRSNEATVAALGSLVEQLRKQDVELVPISALGADVALSAR